MNFGFGISELKSTFHNSKSAIKKEGYKLAVRIRLTRLGKKKMPFYRIVAADSESPRDGRFIEVLGTYNPLKNPAEVKLKEERISYWLKEGGAQLSDTVKSLFRKEGILSKLAG